MAKKNLNQMSEYEHDLTWMAARYAIGRHTIAAHAICNEMVKNVYGRLSKDSCKFESCDIRKEIANSLQFYPFNFTMGWYVNANSKEYKPMARFIEWMIDNNISNSSDLALWKRISYNGVDEEGNPKYEAIQVSGESNYETTDFIDLLEWENLSNLLDVDCHKFCLAKINDKYEFIEYFDTYTANLYNGFEFEKIKVPVESYHNNPYGLPRLIEDMIIKSDMSYDEMMKMHDKIVSENGKDSIKLPNIKYK